MPVSTPYPASPREAERTIAITRILLALAGLLVVWLDPSEPEQYVRVTSLLQTGYILYSVSIAGLVWAFPDLKRLPITTHVVDILVFSVFQYFLGVSNPIFFVYFLFSLFCGALRWGWQGTLATSGAVLATFLTVTGYVGITAGFAQFEVNRFMTRIATLLVSSAFLVYLGRYEQRLRSGIERLARWPSPIGADPNRIVEQVIAYAANMLGAGEVAAVWETADEPRINVAAWSKAGLSRSTYPPGEFQPLVAQRFENTTFVCDGLMPDATTVLVSGDPPAASLSEIGINPLLLALLKGTGLASAPIKTDRVTGRIFFSDIGTPTAEIVPLTEVVTRQIGASLDQLDTTEQLKTLAASEERIRLARDLHDGVLQSLTGIRLEIRSVAGGLTGFPERTRERLFAIERALAIEQRELRFFINGLGPTSSTRGSNGHTLADRLQALRERIALEWKAPVTIRIANDPIALPDSLQQAVPLMVHEAIVNALKHGDPSRVSVTIDGGPTELRIVVADDGHGFPFRGRFDHTALTDNDDAPKSLLDRVSSLGGRMSVESSNTGSRIEMRLSLEGH